jgi:hypothetical protein
MFFFFSPRYSFSRNCLLTTEKQCGVTVGHSLCRRYVTHIYCFQPYKHNHVKSETNLLSIKKHLPSSDENSAHYFSAYFAMLRSIFVSLAYTVLAAQGLCTREKLDVATSRYIAAQSTGQLGWLQIVLSSNATYTENLAKVDIMHNSTLNQQLKIDHAHTIIDTTLCATFSELIITSTANPYIIGIQIRFDTSGNITSIDSIVTTTGDLFFSQFSPSHMLHQVLLEDWEPLPADKRDTRATIQAAADAYYDVFSNHSIPVPWGTPCTRIEGGSLEANGDCNTGIPDTTFRTVDRRYVIDETVGSVNIVSNFGSLGPDSHEFRIEGGKIVRIHSMTLCRPNFNCGLPMPDALAQPATS